MKQPATVVPKATPDVPQEKYLTRRDLVVIHRAAVKQFTDARETLTGIHTEPPSAEEVKPWGTHMDFGTDASMQEVNVINAERMMNGNLKPLWDRVQVLERALQGKGEFRGACGGCGNPIGKERLRACPEATLCIACERKNGK